MNDVVWLVDDDTVCYVCGNACILYHPSTQLFQWLSPSDQCVTISHLALSPTRRLMSLAERGPSGNILTFFEFPGQKRRKSCFLPESSSPILTSAFSSDSRFYAVQEMGPQWTLHILNSEKSKLISTQRPVAGGRGVHFLHFHPTDPSMLVVGGDGLLVFYRVSDSTVKSLPTNLFKRELGDLICGAFVTDRRCIVCSSKNDFIMFTNTGSCIELSAILPSTAPERICSMRSWGDGFLIGSKEGIVFIYTESSIAGEYYQCVQTLRPKDGCKGDVASIDHFNELVVYGTRDSRLYRFTANSNEIQGSTVEETLQLFLGPFHGPDISNDSMHINSVSCCIRKPIFITAGADYSVRVWNYAQKTVELACEFDEVILSVSLHPSGNYAAVSFLSSVKLLNLENQSIDPYHEFFIRGCLVLAYSFYGHLLAGTSNRSSLVIMDPLNCSVSQELPGHSGQISAVAWCDEDYTLFSACIGGTIIMWDVRHKQKLKEFTSHDYCWNSISPTLDGSKLFAQSTKNSNSSVVTFDFSSLVPSIAQESSFKGIQIGSICYSNRTETLYINNATDNMAGMLYTTTLPIGDLPPSVLCHGGKASKIGLSFDEKHVISVGDDGSIVVFSVKTSSKPVHECILPFTDEVLIKIEDIQQKNLLIENLESQVRTLTSRNDREISERNQDHDEKLKELQDDFEYNQDIEVQRYADLQDSTDRMEGSCVNSLVELKRSFEHELADLENTQLAKLNSETNRYYSLCEENDTFFDHLDQETESLRQMHADFKSQLIADYEQELESENGECQQLLAKKESLLQSYRQREKELEEEYESERSHLTHQFEIKMDLEAHQCLKLREANHHILENASVLDKVMGDQKHQKSQFQSAEQSKYSMIRNIEKDIAGHKKEIKEREETISDKEKRIYELKRKNQELEKFKFVLDYKIKELKRQIKPRQEEIIRFKTQMQEMNHELDQYYHTNASLKLTIEDLNMKQTGMENDLLSQKGELSQYQSVLRRFQKDLSDNYKHLNDSRELKSVVTYMFAKYVREYENEGSQEGVAFQDEHNRKRIYFERNMTSLQQKIEKEMEIGHLERLRLMRENSLLTQEINQLRGNIRFMRQTERANLLQSTVLTEGAKRISENEALDEIQRQQSIIDDLSQKLTSQGLTPDAPPSFVRSASPIESPLPPPPAAHGKPPKPPSSPIASSMPPKPPASARSTRPKSIREKIPLTTRN